ncbi:hypothetical protein NIES23_61690 (plasmid) [Trichormus variabilis NIES-23]|uniref:Uncharacterized protein n=1 Tax=Trichormus variabilis NIES-23 TaxID=1973479 RepID=A0A1Z4KWD1_ANAVA|nr:hypothetical protein NIES23_61690 [Trichormus variabilis NIES-23]
MSLPVYREDPIHSNGYAISDAQKLQILLDKF